MEVAAVVFATLAGMALVIFGIAITAGLLYAGGFFG